MATRFADHLLDGAHASRPAANTVPEGTLYACSDHALVYQSDGASWATWATLGSSGSSDGWTSISATLTYSSADSPTFVATTSADLTGSVPVGARIKLTQTTAKYFIVTAIDASTITLYGGTDYTLANAAITVPYSSREKCPVGFPLAPDKWTVETSDTTLRTQTSPVNNTWYNIGSISIVVPIGCWDLSYQVNVELDNSASDSAILGYATLSTANNTESDKAWSGFIYVADVAGAGKGCAGFIHRRNVVTLAAKATRYLNAMSESGGSGLHFTNQVATCKIRALCAYL